MREELMRFPSQDDEYVIVKEKELREIAILELRRIAHCDANDKPHQGAGTLDEEDGLAAFVVWEEWWHLKHGKPKPPWMDEHFIGLMIDLFRAVGDQVLAQITDEERACLEEDGDLPLKDGDLLTFQGVFPYQTLDLGGWKAQGEVLCPEYL